MKHWTLVRNWIQVMLVVVVGVFAAGCGCKTIPPGTVGIKFDGSSGIHEKVIKPRVEWYGVFERLYAYPTSIQNASFVKAAKEGDKEGDDSIPASTVEGAILPIDVTVAYHVDPANVLTVFNNFGDAEMKEIQDEYIRWVTLYAVNVVSGGKPIFDLLSKDRQAVAVAVKEVVAKQLGSWGITVDDVLIGEMHPSDEINAKVQESITVRTQLETVRTSLLRARVEADTMLTNAKKNAELNRLLSLQGKKALQLEELKLRTMAIEKWDGIPPLIGDGNIPFTNMSLK